MNTVQRIAKNTGVLLVSPIASYTIGSFFIMYTARYLGAAGFDINPFKKRLRKMLRISFALVFTGIFFRDSG